MPKTKTTDTILLNPVFNTLTPFQENLYWRLRLISQRYPGAKEVSAEPADLKSTLYPLKRDLRESQVQSALTALTLAGMIAVYPDDTGHPYLRLISADSLNEAHSPDGGEGDYRGSGSSGGGGSDSCSHYNHHQSNENDGETITTTTYDYDDNEWSEETMGIADKLGYTEKDREEFFEKWDKIRDACIDYGLNDAPGCLGDALDLADRYGMDWLLKAMKMSRDAQMKWRFVESVLARWEAEGGPEAYEKKRQSERNTKPSAKTTRKVSSKTDAELDEELKKWGVNLGG